MWAGRRRRHAHLRSWGGRREIGHVALATRRRGRPRKIVLLPLVIHDSCLQRLWYMGCCSCSLRDHLFVFARMFIARATFHCSVCLRLTRRLLSHKPSEAEQVTEGLERRDQSDRNLRAEVASEVSESWSERSAGHVGLMAQVRALGAFRSAQLRQWQHQQHNCGMAPRSLSRSRSTDYTIPEF